MATNSRYRSGTPLIAVHDATAALEFYKAAFDAQVVVQLDAPDGRVLHAAMLMHRAEIIVVDEMPEVGLRSPRHYGGSPFSIIVACRDAHSSYARAVAAGARPLAPVQDDFSGSRHGLIECPFGHRWVISSQNENLTPAQIQERFDLWLAAGEPIEGGPR